jgi:hypothetical protein
VTHITLREIVTGRSPLQWTEAVAIVQGVCVEALRLADGGRPAIPSDSDIRLTSDGVFRFAAAGNPDESPVHQAGALLALLLPPGATPVPLRLEAVAAVGPTPHRSLGDFSAALAPFERPNGSEILRAAYVRLVEGRGPESLPAPPEIAVPRPPSTQEAVASRQPPPPRVATSWSSRDALASFESESANSAERLLHRQVIRWQGLVDRTRAVGLRLAAPAVAGVVVVGMVAAAVWWLSSGLPLPRAQADTPRAAAAPAPPTASPVAAAPSTTTGEEAVSVRPAPPVTPREAPAPVAAPPVPQRTVGSAAAVPGSAGPPRRRVPAATPSPSMATGHAGIPLTREPSADGRSVPPRPAASQPEPAPPRSAETAPRGTDRVDEVIYLSPDATQAAPDPSSLIYSSADKDVRRPVGIRPRFWYDPPSGIPLDMLTQIEVIVTAGGEVESAKIVGGPRSYFDGMFLSAIKAWRFQPATKDGKPVPYRQTIWLLVETAR